MIEQLIPAADEQEPAQRLTPNRSVAPRELVACFAALGTAAMGVAWIAAMRGNVSRRLSR